MGAQMITGVIVCNKKKKKKRFCHISGSVYTRVTTGRHIAFNFVNY